MPLDRGHLGHPITGSSFEYGCPRRKESHVFDLRKSKGMIEKKVSSVHNRKFNIAEFTSNPSWPLPTKHDLMELASNIG